VYTRGDSDVVLSTIENAAMLEVYLLQLCDVVNLHMLANCCVWYYTAVEICGLRNNRNIIFFSDFHIQPVSVHSKRTSSMAAFCDNDVTAPHVFSGDGELQQNYLLLCSDIHAAPVLYTHSETLVT